MPPGFRMARARNRCETHTGGPRPLMGCVRHSQGLRIGLGPGLFTPKLRMIGVARYARFGKRAVPPAAAALDINATCPLALSPEYHPPNSSAQMLLPTHKHRQAQPWRQISNNYFKPRCSPRP